MKKNSQLLLVLSLLFGMLFSYNNCKITKKGGETSEGDEATVPKSGGTDEVTIPKSGGSDEVTDIEDGQSSLEETPDENEDITEVFEELPGEYDVSDESDEVSNYGVKTGEELLESLSVVTGIPYRYEVDGVTLYNEEIFFLNGLRYNKDGVEVTEEWLSKNGVFQQVRNNLPLESSLEKFNSSNLNAITSLSSVFCEQFFKDNHPLTDIPYSSSVLVNDLGEPIDLNVAEPSEADIENLNSSMLKKFVPHIEVDQSGKDLLNGSLGLMISEYISMKQSSEGFISTGYTSNVANVEFGGVGSGTETLIDFNQDWFTSVWIQPIDIENGIGTWTWDKWQNRPWISIQSTQLYLALALTGSAHNVVGHIYIKNLSNNVVWHGEFDVNNEFDNFLKVAPYHVVFQYKNNSSSSVDLANDFHIYVNGQEVNRRNYKNSAGYWPSYGAPIKDTILFNSTQNGEFNLRSRSDIPFGHFELISGDFEDYILEDPTDGYNPIYTNSSGVFRAPLSEEDLSDRNPAFYFGLADPSQDKFIFYQGGVISQKTNANLYRNDRSNWEAPLKMLGPLTCTSILASQYFIFY